MTTLADILAMGGGGLPPVEQFNPKDHALLVPPSVRDAAMQAQAENMPAAWRHRMEPVKVNGMTCHGIGADVLTEALPPNGIFRHVFSHLPSEMAATVLIVPWAEFETMLLALPPKP